MKAGKSSATVAVLPSLAMNSFADSKVGSSVAMPRMSSTSCITGTGFMKWMPMKRSGRSVAAASRVIEIDEVLVASIASGLQHRVERVEDLALQRLVLGRGLDDEVAVAEILEAAAGLMRPSAAWRSASVIAPFETWRDMLPLIVASPAVMRSSESR